MPERQGDITARHAPQGACTMAYALTNLVSYPVKSMRGNSASSMQVDKFGPHGDRRFMLIDQTGRFVSQRCTPKLALLNASLIETVDHKYLQISDEAHLQLTIPLSGFAKEVQAQIWTDSVAALVCESSSVNDALSAFLGKSLRLVYMDDGYIRQVDRQFYAKDQGVGFADGFPFLLCNERSLDDLNARMARDVLMRNFRPNIVFSGLKPYEEDTWRRVRVGDVEFELVKPCSRCAMTTLDEAGHFHKEPLASLATYRRNQYGVCFGQNMVQLNQGKINVEDALVVLEKQ